MTACSKHPGTQAGMQLKELLAECERLLNQVDELRVEELDQFELVDALACELDSSTVQTASSVLCQLRLALKRTDS